MVWKERVQRQRDLQLEWQGLSRGQIEPLLQACAHQNAAGSREQGLPSFLVLKYELLLLLVGERLVEPLQVDLWLPVVCLRHHHLEVEAPNAEPDRLLLAAALLLLIDVVFHVFKQLLFQLIVAQSLVMSRPFRRLLHLKAL